MRESQTILNQMLHMAVSTSKITIHSNSKTKLVIIMIVVGGGVYSVILKTMHNKYCIHQ